MIQRKNKKAVTAVVATALILVVAVVSVIGFQSWFGSFSSKTFVNVEQNSKDTDSSSQIETLIGDNLYFKNNLEENLSINQIKVNGKICNISISNISLGIENINLENCTDNLTTNVADIIIVTDKKIFNKKVFIKDVVISNSASTPTFSCANIPSGLVGLWHFDNIWNDSSTKNHNSVENGAATFDSSGQINEAGKFGTTSDFISVDDSDDFSIDTTGNLTVSFWMKTGADVTNRQGIIQKGGAGNNAWEWVIYIIDNKLKASTVSNIGNNIRIENTSILPNTWYHIIVNFNGYTSSSNIDIYKNGIESSIFEYSNGLAYTNGIQNLKIGKAYLSHADRSFPGLIDDVAIYNRALTSTEVQEIYQAGLNNESICNP